MGTCKQLKFSLFSNPRTEEAAMEDPARHGDAVVRKLEDAASGSDKHLGFLA